MIDEMNSFIRFSKEKTKLLDIGALFGVFSLTFAGTDSNKKAYAIEPSPIAYRTLIKNIKINPELNINSSDLAFGSQNGKLEMYYEWLHLIKMPQKAKVAKKIVVPVLTLDDFTKLKNFTPDIIKIDTEGSEYDVLLGGKKFLKKYKPLIFMETHAKLLKNLNISISKLVSLIYSLGYKIYDLEGRLIDNPKKLLSVIFNYRIILSHKSLI